MRAHFEYGFLSAIIAAVLLLAGCGASPQQDNIEGGENLVETGRDIAERNCASCHAIGLADASPMPGAPPLRAVLADFDIEALATDFREHVEIGTDIMPEFDFSPLETDALMAYLLTIETVDVEN